MSLPTSHLAYTDCFEALDAALEDSHGVRIPVDDLDRATHLRMRLHMARKVDRERNVELYSDPSHPLHGRSQYDRLVCRIKQDGNRLYLYIEQQPSLTSEMELLSEVNGSPVETVKYDEPKLKEVKMAVARRI